MQEREQTHTKCHPYARLSFWIPPTTLRYCVTGKKGMEASCDLAPICLTSLISIHSPCHQPHQSMACSISMDLLMILHACQPTSHPSSLHRWLPPPRMHPFVQEVIWNVYPGPGILLGIRIQWTMKRAFLSLSLQSISKDIHLASITTVNYQGD